MAAEMGPMDIMTPPEAFQPDRVAPPDVPPNPLDELDEPQNDEIAAMKQTENTKKMKEKMAKMREKGMKNAEQMSLAEKKKMAGIQKAIAGGKLKGAALATALKDVGFSLKDLEKLNNIRDIGK